MRIPVSALALVCFAMPLATARENLSPLLNQVSTAFAKLEPQTTRPADGYLKYDYLIPGGYYKQMWDWDGFFIGSHLAHQSRENAKYLKWWVLDFASAAKEIDHDGWVPGVIMADQLPEPKPNPVLGMFMVKPFWHRAR